MYRQAQDDRWDIGVTLADLADIGGRGRPLFRGLNAAATETSTTASQKRAQSAYSQAEAELAKLGPTRTAGVVRTTPFKVTRRSTIQRSTSRREPSPARAIHLATRSLPSGASSTGLPSAPIA